MYYKILNDKNTHLVGWNEILTQFGECDSLPNTAISRKVVGKSARYNPERYCGWCLVHCFSKKFQTMAREAMDVCLRVLKGSNRPFPHYAPVSKHKEMKTRLGWTISYKSLYFVHPSLELVPLFTGMRERSIKVGSTTTVSGTVY